MGRAHEVAIAADAKEFDRGVREDVIKPLADAEEALEDLERAAKSADLDQEITKAQKATDKLDDELDDASDSMKRLGRSGRDAGDDARRGMKGAEDGVKEMGEEAQQSAKETAASFSDVTDALDLVQELAANALSGFGPAGVIAGVAVAAGIGLATAEFQKAEEAAEELRMRAVEVAAEARDAGVSTEEWLKGATRVAERIQELEELKSKDWRWFWEDDPTQLEKWTEGLEGIGRGLDEVEVFLSSGAEAQDDYRASLKKARDAAWEQAEALAATTALADESGQKKIEALEAEVASYDDVLKLIDEEISLRDQSAESYDRQKAAGIDAAAAEAAAAEEKAERVASAQEAVEGSVLSAYDSMRQAAVDYATTEEGALDINRWLEYTQQNQAAIEAYQANIESIKLSPEQWQNLLEMPEAQRMQWVAQFSALPEDARTPFAAALNDVGSAGGDEAAVAFDSAFNPDADVTVAVDTSDAEDDLTTLATKKRTAEIKVKTTGKKAAKDALDELAKKRNVTIEAQVSTASAYASMAAFRRNQESRPITIPVNTRRGRTQLV